MKMKTFICVAVAVLACSAAHASDQKTMPINLVGEWCYASTEQNANHLYKLPSLSGKDGCANILSIEEAGFTGEDTHCTPVSVDLMKFKEASGTSYRALVVARCQVGTEPKESKVFNFGRENGNLSIQEIGSFGGPKRPH
jgi:hypothetical protein